MQLTLLMSLFLSLSFSVLAQSSFNRLYQASLKIPTYRELFNNGVLCPLAGEPTKTEEYKKLGLVSLEQVEEVLDEFFKTARQQLSCTSKWLDPKNLDALLDQSTQFCPHAQKLVLKPGSLFICKGDLHGDVHSLIAFINYLQRLTYLDDLTIVHPQLSLVFHGDYVDRGLWGIEVLYLLMLLKLANPDKVFLIRGNHEDPQICSSYGFFNEFAAKYEGTPRALSVFTKIIQFFELLPVVLYVGSGTPCTDFVQCCHGGLEFGYNPKELLASDKTYQMITHLARHSFACMHDHIPIATCPGKIVSLKEAYRTDIVPRNPGDLGFLWYDFVVDPEGISQYKSGGRTQCSRELTEAVLKEASTEDNRLVGIIRAHQHTPSNTDPLMKILFAHKGCAFLWRECSERFEPGTVITLLLSPDSLYGMPRRGYDGFEYDTSLIVKTGNELKDWECTIFNQNVYEARLRSVSGHTSSSSLHLIEQPLKRKEISMTQLTKSAQSVQDALAAKGLDLKVVELPESTRTAEDAAKAIGCQVAQIAKSLIFRTKDTNRPIFVIASGINRVNEKTIASHVGAQIVKADADFVREVTGFAIGGIPPVGHLHRMETYIDQDLLNYAEVWAAAGTPHAVFNLNSSQLEDLIGGTIISVS